MAEESTPRQTQQTSLPLKAWLFGAWRYENLSGIVVGAVVALLYFILAGYVPAAYVQDSYRPYGALYVKLYPHVFLYPQFYGWLSILLLIPPVLYLKAHPNFARMKKGLLGMLAVVLVLSVMVFTIALCSSNVAPFGLKSELIEGEPPLREHFNKEPPSEAERYYYQKRILELYADTGNWSRAALKVHRLPWD